MSVCRRLGATLLLGASLVGCFGHSATGPAGLPTEVCDHAAHTAATARASSDESSQLDPVLGACTSLPDLEAVSSVYPALFPGGDTRAIAGARCKEPGGPANVPICVELLAAAGPS
jgi:hypothetical protein